MALITGIVGLLGRFAGRLVNSTLGWATVLLFGRVSQQKQGLLLAVVLAALGWLAAVAGVLSPDVGALLLAAVPAPDFIDEAWIRLAMLLAALLLPLVVGIVALFITDKEHRPGGTALLVTVLRGYPFTFVLTLTIVVLAVVASVRKLRSLSRRWQDTHVPLIVKPGAYEQVLSDVHSVLSSAGMELAVKPAPAAVSAPAKLLDRVAGRGLGSLVPDRLMLLEGAGLEILVYPSDLAISGTRDNVARARAAIVSKLTETPAWLTNTREAQALEDELETLAGAGRMAAHREERLAGVKQALASLTVPFEEWETLYRQALQVERDMLREGEPAAPPGEPARARTSPARRPGRLELGAALAILGLIAIDVSLLIRRRNRR